MFKNTFNIPPPFSNQLSSENDLFPFSPLNLDAPNPLSPITSSTWNEQLFEEPRASPSPAPTTNLAPPPEVKQEISMNLDVPMRSPVMVEEEPKQELSEAPPPRMTPPTNLEAPPQTPLALLEERFMPPMSVAPPTNFMPPPPYLAPPPMEENMLRPFSVAPPTHFAPPPTPILEHFARSMSVVPPTFQAPPPTPMDFNAHEMRPMSVAPPTHFAPPPIPMTAPPMGFDMVPPMPMPPAFMAQALANQGRWPPYQPHPFAWQSAVPGGFQRAQPRKSIPLLERKIAELTKENRDLRQKSYALEIVKKENESLQGYREKYFDLYNELTEAKKHMEKDTVVGALSCQMNHFHVDQSNTTTMVSPPSSSHSSPLAPHPWFMDLKDDPKALEYIGSLFKKPPGEGFKNFEEAKHYCLGKYPDDVFEDKKLNLDVGQYLFNVNDPKRQFPQEVNKPFGHWLYKSHTKRSKQVRLEWTLLSEDEKEVWNEYAKQITRRQNKQKEDGLICSKKEKKVAGLKEKSMVKSYVEKPHPWR